MTRPDGPDPTLVSPTVTANHDVGATARRERNR